MCEPALLLSNMNCCLLHFVLGVIQKLRGPIFVLFWPPTYLWWTFVEICALHCRLKCLEGVILTGNQGNHQNFVPSLISKNWFSWGWSNFFFFFFFWKKAKMADSKNWVFQNCQFSIFSLENLKDWSLAVYNKLMPRALM